MRYLPPRRWFQFRLSTWFVLVGILAWAMACWPWIVPATHYTPIYESSEDCFSVDVDIDRSFVTNTVFGMTFFLESDNPFPHAYGVTSALTWPGAALAAFLAWKAAWAVIERRRRQSAASESSQ